MEDHKRVLTDRQRREIEYHRHRAQEYKDLLDKTFSYEALYAHHRRWWNAYWEMYTFLRRQDLVGCKVLVVGCGFGDDALRLAKLGADVYAFDLSGESLALARQMACREHLDIHFQEMAAECLQYAADFFDCIVARDILHHVDVASTIQEIVRVSKNHALLVVNEVYSHSLLEKIRHARVVQHYLYPFLQSFVYDGKQPYITEDECKLTERDINEVIKPLLELEFEQHFNFLVARIVPEKFDLLNKLDRLLLRALKPIGHVLAGRILLAGRLCK